MAKQSGKVQGVSQQNMMDCSWDFGNNACNGGNDYLAYEWMLDHNDGKVALVESYQYQGQEGFCGYDEQAGFHRPGVKGSGNHQVKACFHVGRQWNGTEEARPADMVKALNLRLHTVGPLSVSIST